MAGLAPDEPLQESAVSAMASRISSLRMTAPLGQTDQGYGTDAPSAVLTVQTRDAEGTSTIDSLVVGDKDEAENTYAVKWSDSTYYARVAAYSVGEWVEYTRESFIEPPPTPTPSQ
jgi:hypothetical protein